MGPSDGYVVQWAPEVGAYWGARHALELGNTFAAAPGARPPRGLLPEGQWAGAVEEGWQVGPRTHQGRIVATRAPGELASTVDSCRWSYTTRPVTGWGGTRAAEQRSTAGWAAALPVFEPHWQVCMSHGLATGWVEWGGERFEFADAPAYAEKNWGGQFPEKWFWAQCNAFDGHPGLALTAGGGRRGLLGVPGLKEDVAMVGVHHEGRFYGVLPSDDGASVTWRVAPWGEWEVQAQSATAFVQLRATCAPGAGTLLRAPTAEGGMVPFCKDTFAGSVVLTVREVTGDGRFGRTVVDGARSDACALEVGGGPWWEAWEAEAAMKEPLKSAVRLPVESLTAPLVPVVPWPLKPPGL